VFVLYYACCVASSKQWTQFILLIVSGHCQTGLVLNMPERPELYLSLRDVPRNTNLSSRALGAHVSEVKLSIVIFCVAVLLQSFVCQRAAIPEDLCALLVQCFPDRCVLPTLKQLRRCVLLCPSLC
jgi:hypothetical protein